jgi:hypothetical protein
MKVCLAILLIFAAAGVASPCADVSSGTIGLTGNALAQFSLTLPSAYSSAMNDASGQVNTWNIGNVLVISNYRSWTIAISSANGGYLVNSSNSSEKAQYTMTLGSLVSAQSLNSAWTSSAQNKTTKTGSAYALSIAFTASTTTFWQAGTYSDTLTVTIAGS